MRSPSRLLKLINKIGPIDLENKLNPHFKTLQELNEEWVIDMFGEQGSILQECTEKLKGIFNNKATNLILIIKSKQNIYVYQLMRVLQKNR